MDKRQREAPRDLTPGDQQRLVMTTYWPRLHRGELNIGYGMAKDYLWLQVPVIVFQVAQHAFYLFIEPKWRPRARYLVLNSPLIAAAIVLGSVRIWTQRPSGYYQLNDKGIPIRFLSKRVPPTIQGRVGTSRRTFLRQV